jgi:hypothetical protein
MWHVCLYVGCVHMCQNAHKCGPMMYIHWGECEHVVYIEPMCTCGEIHEFICAHVCGMLCGLYV